MDIDIAPYIKELLYKHNNLVIPGFGNFVLTYASTTIDHVQGMLHPPSKKIAFDSNLLTNDGKLVEFLKEKHQITSDDATALINTFVSGIKAQLGKREMVTLPEVGRLYKDFEDNIQFIPDATNFSKESFGLPTINFYPILRDQADATKKPAIPANPVNKVSTATTTVSTAASSAKKNVTDKAATVKTAVKNKVSIWDSLGDLYWLPGAILCLLLIGIGTCFVFSNSNDATTAEENRINQRPTKVIDHDTPEDPQEDIIDMALEQEQELQDTEDEEAPIDTESITMSPNQKECIVSIGVFGQKANATKMIQKVYDKGYDAYRDIYTKNGNELTKVGVQFAYETQAEYQSMVNRIKQDFPNAVVIKK